MQHLSGGLVLCLLMEFLKRPRLDLEKFELLVTFTRCFKILYILPTFTNFYEYYIFCYHATGCTISRVVKVFRDLGLCIIDLRQCLENAQIQQLTLFLIQGMHLKI